MTIELLRVGPVVDKVNGLWQGDLRMWKAYDEGNDEVVKPITQQYDELKKVEYAGLKSDQRWRKDEYPAVEVSGAQFNCRWAFTRLPPQIKDGDDYRFGWVQNVISDRVEMSYDTGAKLTIPLCTWAPEGLNANEIWYADRREAYINDGSELSDRPGATVPLFCPRSGAVAKTVELRREIKLRDWLAMQRLKDRNNAFLFHFDWQMQIGVRLTLIDSTAKAGDVIPFQCKHFEKPLSYKWEIFHPKTGQVGDTVTCDDRVVLGTGAESPRFGRANVTEKLIVT